MLVALSLLLAPSPLGAVEPAGNWKVKLWQQSGFRAVWLLQIEGKGKEYKGKLLYADEDIARGSRLEELSVAGESLRFGIRVPGQGLLKFECNLSDQPGAKGPTVIHGSADTGEERLLVELERTDFRSLDRYTLSKDFMDRGGTGPRIFDAALTLISKAAEKKSTLKEVTAWAERAFAAADRFGPEWKRYVAINLAEILAANKEHATLAVVYARRAEKSLAKGFKGGDHLKVLTTLLKALESAGLANEAKDVQAQIDRAFSITHFVRKFAGRKNASNNQVVLVELFTGAQCPPCVGPDLAFHALLSTYQPSEVILLQHHLHIPRPDALANPDTVFRAAEFNVFSAPTVVFNGKPAEALGGGTDSAEAFYKQYRETIDPLLEAKSPVRLTLTAVRKGDKVEIAVGAVAAQGSKLPEAASLRVVLVEDVVNYKGGNGITTHHHVVRGLLNGDKGWSLKGKKDGLKETLVVDLELLRNELKKYLDENNKANPFPNDQRPLELSKLRVVEFVQEDATRLVLQAIEAPVVSGGK
jgi:hypothetical protein